jgi:hypothetical protein
MCCCAASRNENEVSVEANAGFIGVMPELKSSVSVEANASFIGVKRTAGTK